jgi:hypothetical protein
MKEERQSGTTTRQMIEAPKDAYYVWPSHLGYARKLAAELVREDLEIIPPSRLVFLYYSALGNKNPRYVEVDHAARLTFEQSMGLLRYSDEMKKTKAKES